MSNQKVTRWLATPAGELTAGELIELQVEVAASQSARQLNKEPAARKPWDKAETLASILKDAA